MFALSHPLAAQEGLRDRDPTLDDAKLLQAEIQTASFHYGPLYLVSRLELSDIGYNEQFFVPTEDQERGLTINLRAPQRLYFVPSKKVILSGEITPSYAILTHHSDRNQGGYLARGDVHLLFNHLYLDIFTQHSDELRALVGEINRISTVRQSESGVAGEFKYSSRTSARFRSVYRDSEHPSSRLQPSLENLDIRAFDRTEGSHRLSFGHKTFPRTSLTAALERSDYDFDRAPQKDSTRSYAAGGFEFRGGRGTLRAELGHGRLDFDRPDQKDFSGALGRFDLTRQVATRWSLTASGARDLDFSLFEQNNYYIADRVSMLGEFATTKDITLRLISNFGRDRYDVPSNGVLRRDRIAYNAVGWMYARRYFRGGFDVGYFERESNVAEVTERDGIRLVLHLSIIP